MVIGNPLAPDYFFVIDTVRLKRYKNLHFLHLLLSVNELASNFLHCAV